jgi:nucleoside-diphosphate-sugar epimerase
MKTIILGKGYVGKVLAEHLPEAYCTRRKKTHPGILAFDLEVKSTWNAIPKDLDNVIWTFPATPIEMVKEFYEAKLFNCKNIIVLGSTSRYIVKREKSLVDETNPFDSTILRVQGEEFLREQGATLLVLAGIYGPDREPVSWLYKGLIRNPRKLLNLIHVDDIVTIVKHFISSPENGEVFNLSDGVARSWDEIGERAGFHFRMPGEREVNKIIKNEKILSRLPDNFKFIDFYSTWQTTN